MEPYASDDSVGVKRNADGALEPTSSTATTEYFRYLLNKPTKYDALFELAKGGEVKKRPLSHGCARLNISPAVARRALSKD